MSAFLEASQTVRFTKYLVKRKECTYHGIQPKGKRVGGGGKFMILFVLNNELTRKRLCSCSIYVVNIIPKHNKSIKQLFPLNSN